MVVVDFSHHQPVTDFAKAKKDGGLEAVISRVSYGKKLDETWKARIDGATTAGLPTASYIYLDFTDPEGQVDFALAVLTGRNLKHRVFIDIENGAGQPVWTKAMDPKGMASRAVKRLLERGYPAGLYSYPAFLTQWQLDSDPVLDSVPYWAADYNRQQTLPRAGKFKPYLWQYGGGVVPGCGAAQVDVNRFLGPPEQLVNFFAGKFPGPDSTGTGQPMVVWAQAEARKGVHEDPPGSNKQPYAAIAGHPNGGAWCMTFQVAGAKVTGTTGIPNTASTLSAIAWAKQHGTWHDGLDGIRTGDLMFRLRAGGGHVEIVVAVNADGTIHTVGGNTTRSATVDPNGGSVVEQNRTRAGWVGYLRPAAPPPTSSSPAAGVDMPILVKVDTKPEYWVSDLLSKRQYVGTMTAAQEYARIGVGTRPDGGPYVLKDPTVIAAFEALPTG